MFLIYSIVMSWSQRQIPKHGILFSLIYVRVVIMFSIAESPNPPGIIHPSHFFTAFIPSFFRVLIKLIFIFTQSLCPVCFKASTTLEYESSKTVYFHISQIVISCFMGDKRVFSQSVSFLLS